MNTLRPFAVVTLAALPGHAHGQLIRVGTSVDAAGLQGIVDQYRNDLGQLNANEPGSVGSGRRQIDWDGAPDAFASPNAFAGDFFNRDFSPLARGIEFETPGTGFEISATAASGNGVNFANINPAYEDQFTAFSPERLFTAIGSNITDVSFFVPGTDQPATTTGFGAVFSDVDIDGSTFIDYFDAAGNLLGRFDAPTGTTDDGSLSFIGVSFDQPIVASVRIYSGNEALGGLEGNGIDLVVMDDFIFGEPIPAPGVLALAPAALIATRRRRRA
ncbi:MAG: hypothetical protein AAFO89_10970 [Planctomycetota bacterium]